MGGLPDGEGVGEHLTAFFGEDQDSTAAIGRVGGNADQAAAFEGLQGCCQRSAIHGQKVCHRTHGRGVGPVQRHEQGKLPVGQAEGAEDFVEAPSQGACGTLHVKAQTGVPDEGGGFVGEKFRA